MKPKMRVVPCVLNRNFAAEYYDGYWKPFYDGKEYVISQGLAGDKAPNVIGKYSSDFEGLVDFCKHFDTLEEILEYQKWAEESIKIEFMKELEMDKYFTRSWESE